MRRVLLLGAAVALLLVAGMLWLLATRTPPPPIPVDDEHVQARQVDDCQICHSPDGPAPRSRNHPMSQRCFQCHESGGAGA